MYYFLFHLVFDIVRKITDKVNTGQLFQTVDGNRIAFTVVIAMILVILLHPISHTIPYISLSAHNCHIKEARYRDMKLIDTCRLMAVAVDIFKNIFRLINGSSLAYIERIAQTDPVANVFLHLCPKACIEFIILWLHMQLVKKLELVKKL